MKMVKEDKYIDFQQDHCGGGHSAPQNTATQGLLKDIG